MRISRKRWPKYLRELDDLTGISYGRCVWPVKRCLWFEENELAHAHVNSNDPHFGWICLRNKSYIRNKDLMLHEYAHIFVGPGYGHSATWRKWAGILGCSKKEVDWYVGKRR
jgi:hypothetical protein